MIWINRIAKVLLSLTISILAIATLAFFLFEQAPLPLDEGYYLSEETGNFDRDAVQERKSLIQAGQQLGLNKPLFYFQIYSPIYPPDVHSVLPIRERKAIVDLCQKGFDHSELLQRRDYLTELLAKDVPYELKVNIINLLAENNAILYKQKFGEIQSKLPSGLQYESQYTLNPHGAKTGLYAFFPRWQWHGVQNRWHTKITDFFLLDWGRSWIDGRSVYQKITDALFWTVLLNGIAFFALFICAIPVGRYWSLNPKSRLTRFSRQLSYLLTVAPLFWIATLCIAFLTSAYGIPIFTLPGAGDYASFSPFVLILPFLVLFLGGIGYLARQFEDSYSAELEKPYVKMSLARGIPKGIVHNQYVVKNAIIPLITLAGAALPSLISGALVIEVLFNIPGMGRLTWHSVLSRDWPMIYSIILLLGVLAWLGRWGADRLSQWIDPRTEMEAI